MPIKLAANAYGKNAVNMSRIIRHAGHHEFRQVSVSVQLTGDFDAAHTLGDNSLILPTDTQKNTVYALAKEHFTGDHRGLRAGTGAAFRIAQPAGEQGAHRNPGARLAAHEF